MERKLTGSYARLGEMLKGAASAGTRISNDDICRALHIKDNAARGMIHNLRAGYQMPVCADAKGYWLAQTYEEAAKWQSSCIQRRDKITEAIDGFEIGMKELPRDTSQGKWNF